MTLVDIREYVFSALRCIVFHAVSLLMPTPSPRLAASVRRRPNQTIGIPDRLPLSEAWLCVPLPACAKLGGSAAWPWLQVLYEKDGKQKLPGKKGSSLSVSQFEALAAVVLLPQLQAAVGALEKPKKK